MTHTQTADITLTDAQIAALPYDVRRHDDAYVTAIDHADHDGECGECAVCDQALDAIRAALPEGWTATWTGTGTGTESDVRIELAGPTYDE